MSTNVLCKSTPEVQNNGFFRDLISNSIDRHLLVSIVVEGSSRLLGNNDDVAVIAASRFFHVDHSRLFRNTLFGLHLLASITTFARADVAMARVKLTRICSECNGHIHLRVGGGIPVMGGSRQSRCQCCSQKSQEMMRRCRARFAVSLQL